MLKGTSASGVSDILMSTITHICCYCTFHSAGTMHLLLGSNPEHATPVLCSAAHENTKQLGCGQHATACRMCHATSPQVFGTLAVSFARPNQTALLEALLPFAGEAWARWSSVCVQAITSRDDFLEAAAARNHGQHVLNVWHHDVQKVRTFHG